MSRALDAPRSGIQVARPGWVWPAVIIEILTGVAAIPVGLAFIADPSGRGMGLPSGWIENTVFGSYLVPGLYLLFVNGLGMLVLAALTMVRHWSAPWLTGILGIGLIVWILVQVAVMPETMILQWIFLIAGLDLAATSVLWLQETGQLAGLLSRGDEPAAKSAH